MILISWLHKVVPDKDENSAALTFLSAPLKHLVIIGENFRAQVLVGQPRLCANDNVRIRCFTHVQ